MGYIELPLEFMGHTFEDMGFPIVKDPVCTQLVERKVLVPGVGARCYWQQYLQRHQELKNTHGGDYLQKLEAAGAHAWAHVLALYSETRVDTPDSCTRDQSGHIRLVY